MEGGIYIDWEARSLGEKALPVNYFIMKLIWQDIKSFIRSLFCRHHSAELVRVAYLICPDCGRIYWE